MQKGSSVANVGMNVSLPEALKEFVQERVAEGTFSTPSNYVHTLIREDMRRQAADRLEVLLMEGINSGPAGPLTAQDWTDVRAEALRRAGLKPSRA